MSEEQCAGTIMVGWIISEKGLGIADIERKLTKEERTALYDRIGELVTAAFQQRVTIWIDGKDKPPVDVFLEANEDEIQIDDGPVNGLLVELRMQEAGR